MSSAPTPTPTPTCPSTLGKRTRISTTPECSPPPPSLKRKITTSHSHFNFNLNDLHHSKPPSPQFSSLGVAQFKRQLSPILKENHHDQGITTTSRLQPNASSLPTPRTTPVKSALPPPPPPPPPTTITNAEPPQQQQLLITPRGVITNIFSHAHLLLSTNSSIDQFSTGQQLLGRESQREQLVRWLKVRFPEVALGGGEQQQEEEGKGKDKEKGNAKPSMYISGPPGIGKTALLSSVLAEFQAQVRAKGLEEGIKVHMENCSSLGGGGGVMGGKSEGTSSIWERLGQGLGFEMERGSGRAKRTAREAFVEGLKGGVKCLIILDEVDAVSPSSSSSTSTTTTSGKITSRDLLNNLFALATEYSTSLTLIGIANSLDLTTKSLASISASTSAGGGGGKGSGFGARAKAKSTAPLHLHFPAYTATELSSIITQRLSFLSSSSSSYPLDPADAFSSSSSDVDGLGLSLIEPAALKLATLKVAKLTGDLRTAFQVIRRAISALEIAERARVAPAPPPTPTKPTSSLHRSSSSSEGGSSTDPLSPLTALTAPKISLSAISTSLRQCGLGIPPALSSRLASLHLHPRLLLLALCVALARSQPRSGFESKALGGRRVAKEEVWRVYWEVVGGEGTVRPLKRGVEWEGARDVLESQGFVTTMTTTPSKSKNRTANANANVDSIALGQYPLDELVEALKEVPSSSCDLSPSSMLSAGAQQETLRISRTILTTEERSLVLQRRAMGVGVAQGGGRDRKAPREGFGGRGLEDGPVVGAGGKKGKKGAKGGKGWIGGKVRVTEAVDEEEEGGGEKQGRDQEEDEEEEL